MPDYGKLYNTYRDPAVYGGVVGALTGLMMSPKDESAKGILLGGALGGLGGIGAKRLASHLYSTTPAMRNYERQVFKREIPESAHMDKLLKGLSPEETRLKNIARMLPIATPVAGGVIAGGAVDLLKERASSKVKKTQEDSLIGRVRNEISKRLGTSTGVPTVKGSGG